MKTKSLTSLFLLTFLFFHISFSMVFADDFQDAMDAANKEKYREAFRLFRQSAEQGNASAQLNVGYLYDKGLGVPQDHKKAFKWYRMAAEQGISEARYSVGYLYDMGWGVPQDYKKAFKWYLMAAEQGHADAQYSVGYLYDMGLGVSQDYVLAHMWFSLSGLQGYQYARESRNVTEKKMTPQKIEEAQKMATTFLERQRTEINSHKVKNPNQKEETLIRNIAIKGLSDNGEPHQCGSHFFRLKTSGHEGISEAQYRSSHSEYLEVANSKGGKFNTKSGYKVSEVACRDLTGDNNPELFLQIWQGGNGSNSYFSYVYLLEDQIKVIFEHNYLTNKIFDLNDDGIQEISSWYPFKYFGGLSGAGSPSIERNFCFKKGMYSDCSNQFPDYLKWQIAKGKEQLTIELKDFIRNNKKINYTSIPSLSLKILAHAILLGNEDHELDYLNKRLPAEVFDWLDENKGEIRRILEMSDSKQGNELEVDNFAKNFPNELKQLAKKYKTGFQKGATTHHAQIPASEDVHKKDKQTYPKVIKTEFDPAGFVLNGDVISPKCITLLTNNIAGEGERKKIKLPDSNGCNDSSHYSGKGTVTIRDKQVIYNEDQSWISYEHNYVGGVHLLNIFSSGGGSGIFNSLIILKSQLEEENSRYSLTLRKLAELTGGDRCNGLIEEVVTTDENRILLKRILHTNGLLYYVTKYSPSDKDTSNLWDGFSYGANSCAGHAWTSIKLDEKNNDIQEDLIYLTFDTILAYDKKITKEVTSCMMNSLPSGNKLKKEELSSYIDAINSKCFRNTSDPTYNRKSEAVSNDVPHKKDKQTYPKVIKTESGGYKVVLGVFEAKLQVDKLFADKFRIGLQKKGFTPEIEKKENTWKLFIGPYPSKEEAYQVTLAISERGLEWVRAIANLEAFAELGDAESQSVLGYMYAVGKRVNQDHLKAQKLLKQAAEKGNANAQYNLGLMIYTIGRPPKNFEESLKWYKLAAQQDNPYALNNIGWLYEMGLGVSQDKEEALRWYRLAADKDDKVARINISASFLDGEGKPRGYQEPIKHMHIAATYGDSDAKHKLGRRYAYGEELNQSYEDALKWFKLAAEEGNSDSEYNLGVMYSKGLGVESDNEESLKWLKFSAKHGNQLAVEKLMSLGLWDSDDFQENNVKADPIKTIRDLNAIGKYQDAIGIAQKVAEEFPSHKKLHTWWGISLVKLEKREEAIKHFAIAVKNDPADEKAHLYWGLTLAMENKFKEAIQHYRTVLKINPEHSNAYAYWGASLNALQKYKDALTKLDESIALHSLNSAAHTLRVDVLYNLKRYEEAWQAVQKAREANISLPQGSIDRLAQALKKRQQKKESIAFHNPKESIEIHTNHFASCTEEKVEVLEHKDLIVYSVKAPLPCLLSPFLKTKPRSKSKTGWKFDQYVAENKLTELDSSDANVLLSYDSLSDGGKTENIYPLNEGLIKLGESGKTIVLTAPKSDGGVTHIKQISSKYIVVRVFGHTWQSAYLVSTDLKEMNYLTNGGVEVVNLEKLIFKSRGRKDYFKNVGGAFWYNAIIDKAGKIIDIDNEGLSSEYKSCFSKSDFLKKSHIKLPESARDIICVNR